MREIDGHDPVAIEQALTAKAEDDRPVAIVARTIKGRGVSFMENRMEWHYLPLSAEQYEQARGGDRRADEEHPLRRALTELRATARLRVPDRRSRLHGAGAAARAPPAPRFINAGVAEQNMVAVAAGLARGGLRPWVYSIAPFCYARPFEQIRNDVCLHDLPVTLVGNGGGYGYGVDGRDAPRARGLRRAAALCPTCAVYVPAFDRGRRRRRRAASTPIAGARPICAWGATRSRKGWRCRPYAPWRAHCSAAAGPSVVVGRAAGRAASCAALLR